MKKIRIVLPMLLLLVVTAGNADAQKALFTNGPLVAAERPNVIMIMADDLGYGDVGFNGNDEIITPHLDAMAGDGIVFDHFYSAAPLCSPTRASCLTGRNPFRQGMFAAHTAGMRQGEQTIAELLKKEGYLTGFFGKWHLGWVEPDVIEDRGYYSPPWHHGYDETFATKSAVPTWDPMLTPEGWTAWGSQEDGSWGGSIYVHNGIPATENLEGDDSRIIMDRVIPFIASAAKEGTPFYATVWFHTPHEPVVAGPEYLAMYPGLKEEQQHYYGAITAMDEQIGRLRIFLREKGIEKNTILFFCSDNGPAGGAVGRGIASAGPFRGRKHELWEGGIRVPSLMEWPGRLVAGQTCSFQSGTVDYLPTILDITGISLPDVPLDGVSLVPALSGEQPERSGTLAFGYQRLYKDTQVFALIDGDYKLTKPERKSPYMLFNLRTDPGETNDLSKTEPQIYEVMMKKLEETRHAWQLSRDGNDYAW